MFIKDAIANVFKASTHSKETFIKKIGYKSSNAASASAALSGLTHGAYRPTREKVKALKDLAITYSLAAEAECFGNYLMKLGERKFINGHGPYRKGSRANKAGAPPYPLAGEPVKITRKSVVTVENRVQCPKCAHEFKVVS